MIPVRSQWGHYNLPRLVKTSEGTSPWLHLRELTLRMRREKMKMLCSHVQASLHCLHYPVAASKMSRISRYRWKKGILKQWRLTFEMLFSTFVRLIQLPAQLLSLSLSFFLCTGFACFLSHDGGCVWSHKGSVATSGTQDNTEYLTNSWPATAGLSTSITRSWRILTINSHAESVALLRPEGPQMAVKR